MKKTIYIKSLLVVALAIYSMVGRAQNNLNYFENVTWLVLASEDKLDQTQHVLLQMALFPIEENETEKIANVRMRLQNARAEWDAMLSIRNANNSLKDQDEDLAEAKRSLKGLESMPELYAQAKAAIEQAEALKKQYDPSIKAMHQSFSEDPKKLLKDVLEVSLGGRLYSGFRDLGNGRLMVTTEPRYYNSEDDVITDGQVEYPEFYTFQYGVIDAVTGATIIPIKYQFCGSSSVHNSIYLVSTDKNSTHAGIMDFNGKIKSAFEYKDWIVVENWCDMAVYKAANGKYGLLHFDGRTILKPIYDKIVGNHDYAFTAYKGQEIFAVDKKGNIVK